MRSIIATTFGIATRRALLVLAVCLLVTGHGACNDPSSPTGSTAQVGQLTLTVADLPAGVDADVGVTGPGGYQTVVTRTIVLADLAPGDYQIVATSVTGADHFEYTPAPTSQTVTVGGGAAAAAAVAYAASDGKLNVVIAGLPAGVDADVDFHRDADPANVWHLVETTLTVSLPPGPYTIDAGAVAGTGGEAYTPAQSQYQTTVAAGQTAQVSVVYEEEIVPPAGATFRVFHGPIKFTGSLVLASYVPFDDYGQLPTNLNEHDSFSFAYPDGYIVDQDCRIVGTDLTEAGLGIGSSISSAFGTGSADCALMVSDGGRLVTITGTASAAASAIGPYIGNGNTVGILEFGYPDGQNLHDLALAIENPSGAPYELRFSWSYDGSETTADYAGWKQYFSYRLDPSPCWANPAFEYLFQGRDFAGPSSGSGTHSLALSGTYHLIGIGLQSEATGGWAMDHLGRGDYGSAQSSATVTIEIVQ